MSSTAVSKYRTSVKVSTATTAAKTITAITKANPVVLTSNTHGLAVGAVVVISGVVGMTEINGVAGVVTAQDTNTFTLGGVDSTNFTAYTSGGSATPQTMTQVENVIEVTTQGEEAETFDATNLMSIKKEKVLGLAGEGAVTIRVHIDPTGPGQERIRKLVGTDTGVAVTVTRSDSKASAQVIKFKNGSEGFPDLHSGEYSGEITGLRAWYA
jgi:hypothetical protein